MQYVKVCVSDWSCRKERLNQGFEARLSLVWASMLMVMMVVPDLLSAQTLDRKLWVPNGDVYDIVTDDSTVYIGGRFDYVGPYTGGGATIDTKTGVPYTEVAEINGEVYSAVSDEAGGFYIAGAFTTGGDVVRENIAHILPDGTVDPVFDPAPTRGALDGRIKALALHDSILYVAGLFRAIGGKDRESIAALDATTGQATSWYPGPASIDVMAVNKSTVYVGGNFHAIGGEERYSLAAIDVANGQVTSWNPSTEPLNGVFVLAATDSVVYVGGYFQSIGGEPRGSLAALDATTGQVISWTDPYANGAVRDLVVVDSVIYVGGTFSFIGGEGRSGLGAINVATGMATSWDPGVYGDVNALAVRDSIVYAGGNFTMLRAGNRNHLAAFNRNTGDVTTWNPHAENSVYALAMSNSAIYAGGDFISVGGASRRSLAALDPSTGRLKPWNPNPYRPTQAEGNFGGYIRALALKDATLYVGGYFQFGTGEEERRNLAALDTRTGEATSWNPNYISKGQVNALAVKDSLIFASSSVGLEAILNTTGEEISWRSEVDGGVQTLDVEGNTVYAGGRFTSIGGQERSGLVALDVTTGAVLPWQPDPQRILHSDPNGEIQALVVHDSLVYVGGDFDFIGGQERSNLAALDVVTGEATSWNPQAHHVIDNVASVGALAFNGSAIYAGGYFDTIGGQDFGSFAMLDATSGEARSSWQDINANQVFSLASHGSRVYAGVATGDLHREGISSGGWKRLFFAGFTDTSMPTGIETDGTDISVPETFRLTAPYPNPFNPETQFSLQIGQRQKVNIMVYDVLGRRVRRLYEGVLQAGVTQPFTFEASDLPSGLYLIRAEGERFTATRRVMLIK